MKLYKFRALGSCEDLKRAQSILETGEFWCSHFWELNDPMEGVYLFKVGMLTDEFIQNLYGQKTKHVICSFSGVNAFPNPIMWGYYANGFKGIAIEIEVDCRQQEIKKMTYAKEVLCITEHNDTANTVKRILTTKLLCWQHEEEYRYLNKSSCTPQEIGKITAVYFGSPYQTTDNSADIQRQPQATKYLDHVNLLKQTAQAKGIQCHHVDIVDGLVQLANPNI